MADGFNGNTGKFTNLDGMEPGYSSAQPAAANRRSSWSWAGTACNVFYLLLLTAVAVIAFILGCYSTQKVRTLMNADAVLVADPRSPGPGYSVYSLGTGLGYWTVAADMAHERSDHGVIAYQKWAYLIGGVSDEGPNGTAKVLASVVRYDTETGVTEEMAPMPEARYRFAYALLNDHIYVMGGTDSPSQVAGPTNVVMVYDCVANSWNYTGKMVTARIDASGAAVNGKVYVFGGYNNSFASQVTTEELDPATATATAPATWRMLPATSNMATSRGDHRATSVENTIYAVGGVEYFINPNKSCDGDLWTNCYRFLSSVEAFDGTTKTWTSRAPMLAPRGDFGISTLPGGRLIVAGGERTNGTTTRMAMYDVEEYIVADDIWVQKAPLPQARFRDDLAYVDRRVYAFGGVSTCAIEAESECYRFALKSVFAYFDVQYPRLYAFYKTPEE